MPRVAAALTPLQIKRLNKVGFNAVGTVAGLGLMISSNNAKSWVYRITIGGHRKNIGLGGYPTVSLKEAIDKARTAKSQIDDGINPIAQKRLAKANLATQAAKTKTFKWCADQFMAQQVFKNEKHSKQWPSTLKTYAYPTLENINVADIELAHIKEILDPIWKTKNTTADRLLGRVRTVIDYAIVCGYRDKANPANWKGYLERIYPASNKVHEVTHMPSMHYSEIFYFLEALKKHSSVSAQCLQFLIHTAVRSGAARAASWQQIDLTNGIWVIPKENTKTQKREHRVPLSKQVISLLKGLPRTKGTDLVFPSPYLKMLSDSALNKLMREMEVSGEIKEKAVPHGFRASFRTWVTEETNHSHELAEISLMHTVGDSVYQAYQRGDGINKRVKIMQDWSNFITQPYQKKSAKVIPLKRAKS